MPVVTIPELQSVTDIRAMTDGVDSAYLYYCEFWLVEQLSGGGSAWSPHGTLYFDGLDDGTSGTLPQFTLDPVDATTTDGTVTISGSADGLDTVHINGVSNPIIYNIPSRNSSGVTRGGSFYYDWNVEVDGLVPGDNIIPINTTDCHGRTSTTTNVTVEYIVPEQPAQVTEFAVTGNTSGVAVDLSWSGYDITAADPDVTQFRIFQSDDDTFHLENERIATLGATDFTIQADELNVNQLYYFGIIANNGYDSPMQVVSVTTVDTEPPTDEPTQVEAVSNTVNSITMTWQPPNNVPADLAGYQILVDSDQWATTAFDEFTIDVDDVTTSREITGLEACRLYSITIKSETHLVMSVRVWV